MLSSQSWRLQLIALRATRLQACNYSVQSGSNSTSTDHKTASEKRPARVSTAPPSTEDSPSSTVYTRPQDAYDPLFADLGPSSSRLASSSVPRRPTSAATPSAAAHRPHARAPLQQSSSRQRQTLSDSEAQTFADLLEQLLPQTSASTAGGTSTGPAGALFAALDKSKSAPAGTEQVQLALKRKVNQRLSGVVAGRRTRTELSPRESDELDRMREQMMAFDTDLALLQWSMVEVFGYSVPPNSKVVFLDLAVVSPSMPSADQLPQRRRRGEDTSLMSDESSAPLPRGPSSPIYSDLLLMLFLLLRDSHANPFAALHVFQLASASPYSYVQGCGTSLYNEVLRTRWMEGDVESVADAIDEMRAAGVRMDDKTREIVAAIGEAIRTDGDRAELRAARRRDQASTSSTDALTPEQEHVAVDRSRFFSQRQIAAWSRMERVVEENVEESIRRKKIAEEDRWREKEAQRTRDERTERETAERERPNLFFGAEPPSRGGGVAEREGRDRGRSMGRRSGEEDFRPRLDERADGFDDLMDMGYVNDRAATGEEPTKRPSFANPYKIRRQALTKADKSKRDSPHPMLFFKKKA